MQQKTLASQLLHDFDKIHPVIKVIASKTRDPKIEIQYKGLFEEFLAYAKKKVTTDIGQQFLSDIESEQMYWRLSKAMGQSDKSSKEL